MYEEFLFLIIKPDGSKFFFGISILPDRLMSMSLIFKFARDAIFSKIKVGVSLDDKLWLFKNSSLASALLKMSSVNLLLFLILNGL
jgi:hypothetical protein